MRKSFVAKTVALALCLVFIGISASGLFAAEKRASKIDARLLLQRPVQFLISIFPALGSIFNVRKTPINSGDSSSSIVKPTGELVSGRPSTGD
jgi:hypothetical protein